MNPTSLAEAQVVIVGLGLMGASLGHDVRGSCRQVVGIARRPETVQAALACGCVDAASIAPLPAVATADLVILATPVRTLLRQIAALGPHLKPGALLLDLGSTKTAICQALAALPPHVQVLGGHPMCGKEKAGIEAAEPGLYRGCTFVLSPLPRTSAAALTLAHDLIAHLGARPLVLAPERHDQLVAAISHLPYLSACALVDHVRSVAEHDPTVWEVAASGFRDSSRVAASDVEMLLDILLTNRPAVLAALDGFLNQIEHLRTALAVGDEQELRQALNASAAARRTWGAR